MYIIQGRFLGHLVGRPVLSTLSGRFDACFDRRRFIPLLHTYTRGRCTSPIYPLWRNGIGWLVGALAVWRLALH